MDPDHNMTSEEAKRFVITFLDSKAIVNNLTGQLNGIRVLFKQVLKNQGIELPRNSQ